MELDAKNRIAKRVAQEFQDGDVVNLGIGVPTLATNYVPAGVNVIFQSENGIVGIGGKPQTEEEIDKDICDAGGFDATLTYGACVVDSNTSFGLIRGKHLAATVLGTLEVDQYGNIANYTIPGKMMPGMGGAMDLVCGARKVIVASLHNAPDGSPKIVEQCTLPLTGARKVKLIVTEIAVMEVTPEGLLLKEVAPGITPAEVQARTGCKLIIPETVPEMNF